MNILLIFFAIPIAVIIVSAILQKVLKSPIAVAALIFAIFLVVTFAIGDITWLIATLAYTVLSLITTIIVKIICEFRCCNLMARNFVNSVNNGTNNTNFANIFTESNKNGINTNAINSNAIRTNVINTEEINTNTIRTNSINTGNNTCRCRCNKYKGI